MRLARKTARKVAAVASTSRRVGRAGSRQRSAASVTRRTAGPSEPAVSKTASVKPAPESPSRMARSRCTRSRSSGSTMTLFGALAAARRSPQRASDALRIEIERDHSFARLCRRHGQRCRQRGLSGAALLREKRYCAHQHYPIGPLRTRCGRVGIEHQPTVAWERAGGAVAVRDFDIDCERRDGLAAIHLDLHLVRIEGDMAADHREYLLAQDAEQVRLVARIALVREQDLQAFSRNGRGAAAKQIEKIHAAFRPNSLLKMPRLSLGICMGICSPLSRRVASK